jgi:hypothetical protein
LHLVCPRCLPYPAFWLSHLVLLLLVSDLPLLATYLGGLFGRDPLVLLADAVLIELFDLRWGIAELCKLVGY